MMLIVAGTEGWTAPPLAFTGHQLLRREASISDVYRINVMKHFG
jgi:hypothetical protein